jgi:hypothetical protein
MKHGQLGSFPVYLQLDQYFCLLPVLIHKCTFMNLYFHLHLTNSYFPHETPSVERFRFLGECGLALLVDCQFINFYFCPFENKSLLFLSVGFFSTVQTNFWHCVG